LVVGATVGAKVGAVVVGATVGAKVGVFVVGATVGAGVGAFVVGAAVGARVGAFVVGAAVGAGVGTFVVGAAVGGPFVGVFVQSGHWPVATLHVPHGQITGDQAHVRLEQTPLLKTTESVF
jgi:hypothetical protein